MVAKRLRSGYLLLEEDSMSSQMDPFVTERLMRMREELAHTEARLMEAIQDRDRYKEAFERIAAVFDAVRPQPPEQPPATKPLTINDLDAFFEKLFSKGNWPGASGEDGVPTQPAPSDPTSTS